MADMQEVKQQLAEAEDHAARLLDGIQSIEVQLGAPSRYDPASGQPMTEERYAQWRYRANHAKAMKLAEYRGLKPKIHALRETIQAAERPYSPPLTTRQVEILNHVWADLAEGATPLWSDTEDALYMTADEGQWLKELTSTALEIYTGGPKDG